MSEKTKIMTVMTAMFAVAIMLAVPILTAVDTDAAFEKGEAGLCKTLNNPTNAEVSKYMVGTSRADVVTEDIGTSLFMCLFRVNTALFDEPTATVATLNIKDYMGVEIGDDWTDMLSGREVTAESVSIEYTATGSGELLDASYDNEFSNYKDAYDAIKAYFGDSVSIDDKLTVTGTIKSRHAFKDTTNFAAVDDTKNVMKDEKQVHFILYDTDVSIAFTHGGETKTISFRSNQSFEFTRTTSVDYKGKAYTDLTASDKCDISYLDSYDYEAGSTYYKVNGTDCKVKDEMTPLAPEENQPVEFITNNEIQSELNGMKLIVNNNPASSGNVTVDKTYDAAKSAYSALGAEVMIDDLLLIIVAVVIGVVILILLLVAAIVIVVIVKKKKKNQ